MGTAGDIATAFARFLPPDASLFPELVVPAIETFMMAVLGTVLGATIALPVAWLGAWNITPLHWFSFGIARGMMTLSRSIHELVWALIFVSAVGLGTFPGILAVACRSVGFISKLTAEAIERIDRKPVEAITACGGNRIQVLFYAIIPQVMPTILSTVIFEWDINIRRAAIMGLVGAGGLGLTFHNQMQSSNYAGVTSVLIVILLIMLIGEVLSHYSRKAVT
jgi:phosphonate transport system permease protein